MGGNSDASHSHIVGLPDAMTIDDVEALPPRHLRNPAGAPCRIKRRTREGPAHQSSRFAFSPHAKPSLVVLNDCVLACKEEDHAMPIGITDRIVALFAGLTREEVDMLPPVRRAQFADLCRHWANFAEIRPDAPKSGVLVALRTRRRDE